MTDITNFSDALLDTFLRIAGGEDGVTVEHLSPKERSMLCDALGIEASAYWIAGPVVEKEPAGPDYEGAILDRADAYYYGPV